MLANNNTAANALVDCDLRVDGNHIADGDGLVREGNANTPAERLFMVRTAAVELAAAAAVTMVVAIRPASGLWSDRRSRP